MDFSRPLQFVPFLVAGVAVTLVVSAIAIVLAAILGLFVAYARLSRFRTLRAIGTGFVVVIQSVPFFALLLWVYFVLPAILGIVRPDIYVFGIATLALSYAAFFGEVYRTGILSIAAGQRDAGLSSGMSERQVMRRIVFPQAIRNTVPPFTSLCVSAVKDLAIIGPVLGVQEIIWHASVVSGTTFRPAETFILAALLYVAITFPLTLLGNYLHRRWQIDPGVGGGAFQAGFGRFARPKQARS